MLVSDNGHEQSHITRPTRAVTTEHNTGFGSLLVRGGDLAYLRRQEGVRACSRPIRFDGARFSRAQVRYQMVLDAYGRASGRLRPFVTTMC